MQNTPYRLTKHMASRMSQRGIPRELVDLVYQYGRDEEDKLVLDGRDLRALLDAVRCLQRSVIKGIDKGGMAIVSSGGALILQNETDRSMPDPVAITRRSW